MRVYNAANPNGPGVDSLPHYAERERHAKEMRDRPAVRESRYKLNDRTRCVWTGCNRHQMKYDGHTNRRWAIETSFTGIPLCRHHVWVTHQVGFEMGMLPEDENGEFIHYVGRKYDNKPSSRGHIYYIRVGDAVVGRINGAHKI